MMYHGYNYMKPVAAHILNNNACTQAMMIIYNVKVFVL